MATKITVSNRGSGTSNYTAYTSVLHLGGGYRTLLTFNLSSIPAGATIKSVVLHMSHSSSTYRAAQSVVFKTSASGYWSYSSTGSTTKTSVQVSGNHYSWDISALGAKMLALGDNCNLHLSTSDGTDRPYDGTKSAVYLMIEYETPSGDRWYRRINGNWVLMDTYRQTNGSKQKIITHRRGATEWD